MLMMGGRGAGMGIVDRGPGNEYMSLGIWTAEKEVMHIAMVFLLKHFHSVEYFT